MGCSSVECQTATGSEQSSYPAQSGLRSESPQCSLTVGDLTSLGHTLLAVWHVQGHHTGTTMLPSQSAMETHSLRPSVNSIVHDIHMHCTCLERAVI